MCIFISRKCQKIVIIDLLNYKRVKGADLINASLNLHNKYIKSLKSCRFIIS